ncbi:MAG: TraR/DksA C4-type zinc finger protein [Nannocystaceae bacterium]
MDLDEPIGRLSRMEAIQQANLASSNRDASERRLRLVSAALSRLTDVLEDYGLCVVCDEGIGYPRLKARPEATMCVACQSSREQSVAATRR